MRGAVGMQAQSLNASQTMRAPMGMFAQDLSGNKRSTVKKALLVASFSGTSGGTMDSYGALAGDILIGVTAKSGRIRLGSNNVANNVGNILGWQVLTGPDLALSWQAWDNSATLVAGYCIILRGPTSLVSVVSDTSNSTHPTSTAGFLKNAGHMGLIAAYWNNSGGISGVITAPPGWTNAGPANNPFGASVTGASALQHRIGDPAYVSNAAFTWNASDSGSSDLYVMELRG